MKQIVKNVPDTRTLCRVSYNSTQSANNRADEMANETAAISMSTTNHKDERPDHMESHSMTIPQKNVP
jgi:hypothetical protein